MAFVLFLIVLQQAGCVIEYMFPGYVSVEEKVHRSRFNKIVGILTVFAPNNINSVSVREDRLPISR